MCPSGVERFPVLIRLLALALLLFCAPADAYAAPKRVLIIHSFGQDFPPWSEYSKHLRSEMFRRLPQAVDLFEATLETARIPGDLDEGPFAEYLHALFKGRPLDLVITVAAPAARFVERNGRGCSPRHRCWSPAWNNGCISLRGWRPMHRS